MAAVALPDWLDFRPWLFPSCNFAWLRGPQPILVAADIEVAIATLERIGLLDAHVAVAGHGEVIEDVADCIKRSLERLWLWRQEPARMAYHGSRRIFGFATHDPWRISPLPTDAVPPGPALGPQLCPLGRPSVRRVCRAGRL